MRYHGTESVICPILCEEDTVRRKDTTQDDLRGHVAAALLRLLEDRELSQVAVKELAAEAGVSRSTFYRLFEGKDQVHSVK